MSSNTARIVPNISLLGELNSADDPRVPEFIERMASHIRQMLPTKGSVGFHGLWYYASIMDGKYLLFRAGFPIEGDSARPVIEGFLNDLRNGLLDAIDNAPESGKPEEIGMRCGVFPPW